MNISISMNSLLSQVDLSKEALASNMLQKGHNSSVSIIIQKHPKVTSAISYPPKRKLFVQTVQQFPPEKCNRRNQCLQTNKSLSRVDYATIIRKKEKRGKWNREKDNEKVKSKKKTTITKSKYTSARNNSSLPMSKICS